MRNGGAERENLDVAKIVPVTPASTPDNATLILTAPAR